MAEVQKSGMQVYYTVDLSVFKEITSNREVNKGNVKKLVAAIKKNNLLRVNPIIVDRKMNVIDGQHRLEACKILKEGIFYMLDDHISQSDIAALNSNMRNWTPADYVNYWAIEKAPGFDKISKLLSIYPWLNISAALQLIGLNKHARTDGVREGKLDISNYDNAVSILEKLNALREDYPFVTVGKFITVFRKLTELEHFDYDHLLSKIESNRRGFYQCAKSFQYIEMIEELYNRGLHEKNKIYFTKLIK